MPQRKLKEEYDMEDPWRYMADLPLEHVPTMRRVMLLIYHKLNPGEKIFPMPALNWTFLSRGERKRVMTMIKEAKDNDLLAEMLGWFSAQFMAEDKEVVNAARVLKRHVVNAVRQPKSYQVEYLKERKKWYMFRQTEEDEDMDMGCMDSSGGLSPAPHLPPSEFITSVGQKVEFYQETTQLPVLVPNSLNATKPLVQSTFQPSYSYKSETWREEICFENAASAEAHYSKVWGERSFSESNKRKQKDIEVPYSFTIADEDVSPESDPDDREEVINIFETKELPGRKTRAGKEFSTYVPPYSKKQKISPEKSTSSFKATSASKTKVIPKVPASKSTLTHRTKFVDEDEEIDDWEPNMA